MTAGHGPAHKVLSGGDGIEAGNGVAGDQLQNADDGEGEGDADGSPIRASSKASADTRRTSPRRPTPRALRTAYSLPSRDDASGNNPTPSGRESG